MTIWHLECLFRWLSIITPRSFLHSLLSRQLPLICICAIYFFSLGTLSPLFHSPQFTWQYNLFFLCVCCPSDFSVLSAHLMVFEFAFFSRCLMKLLSNSTDSCHLPLNTVPHLLILLLVVTICSLLARQLLIHAIHLVGIYPVF